MWNNTLKTLNIFNIKDIYIVIRHNDLPWNIRKFLRNQINEFELDTDLTQVEPWSISKYSHTDLPRLREGMVGAQVRIMYMYYNFYTNLKFTILFFITIFYIYLFCDCKRDRLWVRFSHEEIKYLIFSFHQSELCQR